MGMLKKSGLVKSIRGAGGGYVLAKDASEISVGDILRALEGSLDPVDCSALNSEEGCQIVVVDSKCASMGEGLFVHKAVQKKDQRKH
jgi:Rrf2 family protein